MLATLFNGIVLLCGKTCTGNSICASGGALVRMTDLFRDKQGSRGAVSGTKTPRNGACKFRFTPLGPLCEVLPGGDSRKACGKTHFTLPHDRQSSREARRVRHPEGHHLLSLFLSDSITFLVTRDRHGTSASLRSPECCIRYPDLQPGIRFFPPPSPACHQHALRFACPRGDGTGFPRSVKLILWMP